MQFSGSVPPLHHTPPSFAHTPPPSPLLVSGALFTILLTLSVCSSSIYQAVPFQLPHFFRTVQRFPSGCWKWAAPLTETQQLNEITNFLLNKIRSLM